MVAPVPRPTGQSDKLQGRGKTRPPTTQQETDHDDDDAVSSMLHPVPSTTKESPSTTKEGSHSPASSTENVKPPKNDQTIRDGFIFWVSQIGGRGCDQHRYSTSHGLDHTKATSWLEGAFKVESGLYIHAVVVAPHVAAEGTGSSLEPDQKTSPIRVNDGSPGWAGLVVGLRCPAPP